MNLFSPAYYHALRPHGRLLLFGIIMALASSFGQTFLISLSAPQLMASFRLDNTSWGAIYAGATLLSALCLTYFGRLLDKVPLRTFSIVLTAGLGLSCLSLSLSPNLLLLFLSITGLRLTGQGLCGLTALATMARAFVAERGVALSIASMGFPLGEILFPPAILFLIVNMGWRLQWAIASSAVLFLLLPLIRFLLAHPEKWPPSLRSGSKGHEDTLDASWQGWTLSQVFKDWRIYVLLPVYVMPGFLATGFILHQFRLAEEMGWSAALMGGSFVAFGATRLLTSLLVGPLIDRFSALRLFPFQLLPFMASLLTLRAQPGAMIPSLYYGLMGICLGLGGSTTSAMWAELYGARYLGSIKSLMSTLGIICTAISPLLLGWALDHGLTFQAILVPLMAGLAFLSFLSYFGCNKTSR